MMARRKVEVFRQRVQRLMGTSPMTAAVQLVAIVPPILDKAFTSEL